MNALIVYGGWENHEPEPVARVLAGWLGDNGVNVELSDSLEPLGDADRLAKLDLLVVHWTMGELSKQAGKTVAAAVGDGLGLAGMHGGLADAFRGSIHWNHVVGGQFVAHPGGIKDFRVHVVDHADPITAGVGHFDMHSEQYYLHVDPVNHVLATTTFEHNGCTMPVVWKRTYGRGRVFYCSLGHVAAELEVPEFRTIMTRGMLWAAAGRGESRGA